jgi:hypothetical protein
MLQLSNRVTMLRPPPGRHVHRRISALLLQSEHNGSSSLNVRAQARRKRQYRCQPDKPAMQNEMRKEMTNWPFEHIESIRQDRRP